MALTSIAELSPASLAALPVLVVVAALVFNVVYNLYFHPLAKFHGPWYAASFSICVAIISVLKREPQWLLALTKQYGTSKPIRIAPGLLMFPEPGALKDIYCDPKCNLKSKFYGTGAMGPPQLFTTLDGNLHKTLRKALGGPQWSIGSLKKNWEPRIDKHVQLFVQRMSEFADRNEPVILCDKVAEFAADIMTIVCFTDAWGFVTNSRDERHILSSWRKGLPYFGFVGRFNWLRERVQKASWGHLFLPNAADENGMGYLMGQADRQVSERERRMDVEGFSQDKPDYMQYCLEARIDGEPLTPAQKRAHVTLLIQAGADTTGTGLGSTLRFLLTSPKALSRAREEIDAADAAGLLSSPIQYEEARAHLHFFGACIKESLRLHPPAPQMLPRLTPGPDGKVIDRTWVPAGTEILCNPYVVQRDPWLYGPEAEAFRPERWLEGEVAGNSKEKIAEMDSGMFMFGMGPRICLGKDIAVMELHKLLPEIVRRFDFDLKREGEYIVAGGVGYNQGLEVQLHVRGN